MNDRDRLGKLIAKGRWHFILVRGVLGWGLGSAALIALWQLFSRKHGITVGVVMPFVVLPPFGIFWGAWMWRFLKRRYDKMLADVHDH